MDTSARILEIINTPQEVKLEAIRLYCEKNHKNCLEKTTSFIEVDQKLCLIDQFYFRITRPHLVYPL